ncbi:MFS transporter [Clostridium beijerinckii]|uniref:Purine efflux pump PbuE n=1 Tax=Clostridium beijerinckii TaxID=1520 RepID=A0A1S8SAC7_CLOBE|nr:MFS transporter [Clostridium beijerinckii]NRY59200.1 putative MFS family arabinose efflux permease [Clostridium beijerinckii]OOM62500.1 purine efflux pump PbuE [Clostridium beijerinckii]
MDNKENMKNLNWSVFILFMIIFLIGADTFLVSPLIPTLSRDFNVTVSQSGLLVIAYSLPYAICGFAFGPLSDKVGRRTMLKWGILAFSIFTLLCGCAWNFGSLFVFRALSGIAAATSPQVWAAIGDIIPFEKRGRVVGVVTAALSISQILGVPLGAFVAGVAGWRFSFYIIGILGAIVTLLIMFSFPVIENSTEQVTKPTASSNLIHSLKLVLTNKRAVFGLLVTFFMMFASFGMYSFLGAWLSNSFNMSVSAIGTIIVVVGFGNLIGNLSGGLLGDYFGKGRVVIIGLTILAVALSTLPYTSTNISLAIPCILVWLMSAGASLASLNSIISELVPSLRGTVMSLNSSFMYIGTTIGVIVGGNAINKFGYAGLGFVYGISAFIAMIIICYVIKLTSEESKEKVISNGSL